MWVWRRAIAVLFGASIGVAASGVGSEQRRSWVDAEGRIRAASDDEAQRLVFSSYNSFPQQHFGIAAHAHASQWHSDGMRAGLQLPLGPHMFDDDATSSSASSLLERRANANSNNRRREGVRRSNSRRTREREGETPAEKKAREDEELLWYEDLRRENWFYCSMAIVAFCTVVCCGFACAGYAWRQKLIKEKQSKEYKQLEQWEAHEAQAH